jgi:hypothetical protein
LPVTPGSSGAVVGGEEVAASLLEADRKPDGQLRQDNVFRYVLAVK